MARPARTARPERRPPGRRAGETRTRDAILAAAGPIFAREGYAGASLRVIAADAGVDPALIRHFFGGKDGLFAATLERLVEIPEAMTAALAGRRDRLGERVTRAYLGLWEDPVTGAPIRAVVRSAVGSPRAAELLRELLGAQVLRQAAPVLGADAELRASLAGAHLVGIAIARYLVAVEPIASLDHEDLVALVAPAVQRALTGRLPPP